MKQVTLGIVGLGRIGKSHALNLLKTVGCELRAACSIVPDELVWAREHIPKVAIYDDYDNMLAQADVDSVFLATTTAVHAEQVTKGLRAGKHVFCEKPIGINVKESREVIHTIRSLTKDKVFMLGLVRRFDPSYVCAKKQIEEGVIGTPFMVKSETCDHDDFAAFQVKFVATGGGIFHDMNVHDIDLARWYLGTEPTSVYAIGSSFVHNEFGDIGDADNTIVSCEFEEGKMAIIGASRTAFNGHCTKTEIFGTKGVLRVGFTPSVADVEIFDAHGQRKKSVYTFYDRFEEAFKREAQTFIDCIQGRATPKVSVDDALQVTVIAEAFTQSFRQKKKVFLSDI